MPPVSQELLTTRDLAREIVTNDLKESDAASVRIRNWHMQIKNWQDTDSLSDAFQEGRLTFRQMSHPETRLYDYRRENPARDPLRERILGIINNDSHQKPITNNTRKNEDGVWVLGAQRGGNIRLDAGGAGIVRRLDPNNFLRTAEAPQSSKFRLGLHALSASLLNPEGYVLKKYTESVLIVLMPLPLPEDVQLFYELRDLSKTGGCGSFQGAMVTMASEFTRPQLASRLDMGTQYVMTTSTRHGQSSVKYVRGTKNLNIEGQSPTQCRFNARNNYKVILGPDAANEITVNYRRCGNRSLFPVFAISLPDATEYLEVTLTIPEQAPPRKYGSPPPRNNPFYAETGSLISGENFTTRQA